MSERQHMTVVRNGGYRASEFRTRQRHNERQNEDYYNVDIRAERADMNFHYLKHVYPDGSHVTYEERFNQLLATDAIAKRGLKPDAKVFAELIFDVNTDYFEQNGGYEFAVKYFAEAYKLAVREVGDEKYILSAVMHADERNKEASERLGHDVYHYHLHVIYVPVVEKKVYYRKDMKDREKAGTLKEIIPQISHSKKWPIKTPVERDGATIMVNSYSLLQDRYFEHMVATGFPDLQRGERGSKKEHLTAEEYKYQQEKKRAEEAAAKADAKEKEVATLEEQARKKQARVENLDKQISVKEKARATIEEVNAMGRPQTIGNGFIVTAGELKKLKSLAKKGIGIDTRADEYKDKIATLEGDIRTLKGEITSLQQSVRSIATDRDTWKANYERLWNEVKGFIHAIRRTPKRLLELISEHLPDIGKSKNQEVSR